MVFFLGVVEPKELSESDNLCFGFKGVLLVSDSGADGACCWGTGSVGVVGVGELGRELSWERDRGVDEGVDLLSALGVRVTKFVSFLGSFLLFLICLSFFFAAERVISAQDFLSISESLSDFSDSEGKSVLTGGSTGRGGAVGCLLIVLISVLCLIVSSLWVVVDLRTGHLVDQWSSNPQWKQEILRPGTWTSIVWRFVVSFILMSKFI